MNKPLATLAVLMSFAGSSVAMALECQSLSSNNNDVITLSVDLTHSTGTLSKLSIPFTIQAYPSAENSISGQYFGKSSDAWFSLIISSQAAPNYSGLLGKLTAADKKYGQFLSNADVVCN